MIKSTPNSFFIPFVELLDFFTGKDKNTSYLVFEYCGGGNLRDFLKQMINQGIKIDEKDAWLILNCIVQALSVMHKYRIIHADLKPENVLFTEDKKLKLADFGLSRKLREEKDYTSVVGGSWFYIAPELLPSNRKENEDEQLIETTAVDIWSLGVIMFELLAWYHPFSHGKIRVTSLEILLRLQNEDPAKLPDDYSEKLRNLIMRMLEKDPMRRITAEQILSESEVIA
ncbi:MAG: putative Phosphoenolpyruvate carboxylase kinase 1 [Streblomastix strix]|uniref:Putative Phosphoenolpyruvate carboxylase kinase 1 n=1 Tax=Streblomastix strix TaxID=222440 RepID=A0A5J4W1M5_9EUKA|nr:MAG: putative Phosphoenolpyruvate carboxylase kinase 1 [Streblomastix strix]